MATNEPEHPAGAEADAAGVTISAPDVLHGAGLWQVASDSKVLDLNSRYAYLLWCHDFADTSAVALDGAAVVGFVTGYLRPAAPDTLMIWQVAVNEEQRGRGLAARMLHDILDRLAPRGVRWLHTTISPDNDASIRLFTGVARDRGTTIQRRDLFGPEHFPDGHEPEDLYVLGPFPEQSASTSRTDRSRTEQ